MAKKKAEDAPPPGAPAWMVTFSDMMNLLMCFFVLLFAMSNVDAEKFELFAASFSQAFSVWQGGGSTVDSGGVMIGNGASQLTEMAELYSSMGLNTEGQTIPEGLESGDMNEELKEAGQMLDDAGVEMSEEMALNIAEALYEQNLEGMVDIEFNAQYVLLRMSGAILFDSGRAELKDEALNILSRVAPIIQRYAQDTVQIEGHTDNVPMSSGGKYGNNDELSGGRAYSVFMYLMDNTSLDPRTTIHAGRGEYDPIADNGSAEGRAMNRRVEIKLFNALSSY